MLDHLVEAFQRAQPYIHSPYASQVPFQDLLFSYVASMEYKCLEINDLNLSAPNGYDILAGLLNTCN